MQTWYECRVKYLKIDNNGFERRVTDTFLLDAVSYTDAETRINELMPNYCKGEFQVVSIKQSNIAETIGNEGDCWWKVKISTVTIDEVVGREKKANNYLLVAADNLAAAVAYLNEGLEYMLVSYFIESVALTQIGDVFHYNLAAGVERMEANEEMED